jgi:hypothetical protein
MKFGAVDNLYGKTYMKESLCKARNPRNLTSKLCKLLLVCIGYSTIETKEAARIGYNGFLFPHSYSGDGLGRFCK